MTEMKTAAILGAGQMGREIALVLALGGFDTFLYDISETALDNAAAHIEKSLNSGRYDPETAAETKPRLSYGTTLQGLEEVDLFVEAVSEIADIKNDLFARLDDLAKPEAIFASNTSSIPITSLAVQLPPERRPYFIGMHFSSPASRMDFVEIIPCDYTSKETLGIVVGLGPRINKTVTQSKDVPGFVINRLLFAMLAEAQRLVEEGVATVEDIDISARQALNHKVGPFQIMDQATNGLMLQIHDILQDHYGDRFAASDRLRQLVADGKLGRNAGQGWYAYPEKKSE